MDVNDSPTGHFVGSSMVWDSMTVLVSLIQYVYDLILNIFLKLQMYWCYSFLMMVCYPFKKVSM